MHAAQDENSRGDADGAKSNHFALKFTARLLAEIFTANVAEGSQLGAAATAAELGKRGYLKVVFDYGKT